MTKQIPAQKTTRTANKGAATKPANKGKTTKPEVKTEETAPVETFAQKFARIIAARNVIAPSKDLDTARSVIIKGASSVNALYANPHFSHVLDQLATDAGRTEAKGGEFIAVKALVKIAHAMIALASGVSSEFDPYTRTICKNLAGKLKDDGITNKSALVSLSKAVTYDALDQQQHLSAQYNCSAGTATTQASSTRMMLRALGLCAVEKGKRGDVTRVLPNERCAVLLTMFSAS
jgi:hypothetical protein